MGLNRRGSAHILLLLPVTRMLLCAVGCALFPVWRRLRYAITFILLVKTRTKMTRLRTMSSSISHMLNSKHFLRLYSLLVLSSLAEALLVQTCGMPFPQLTRLRSSSSPLLALLGFCYSVANIFHTLELMLLRVQSLVKLFAPVQLLCLCLAARFVLVSSAGEDGNSGVPSYLPYLADDLNASYDKWVKLWHSFLYLGLNTALFQLLTLINCRRSTRRE